MPTHSVAPTTAKTRTPAPHPGRRDRPSTQNSLSRWHDPSRHDPAGISATRSGTRSTSPAPSHSVSWWARPQRGPAGSDRAPRSRAGADHRHRRACSDHQDSQPPGLADPRPTQSPGPPRRILPDRVILRTMSGQFRCPRSLFAQGPPAHPTKARQGRPIRGKGAGQTPRTG